MKKALITLIATLSISVLCSCRPNRQSQDSSSSESSSSESSSSSSSSSSSTTSISPEPGDYYSSITDSMSGDTLKVALYNIIKGHTKYSYDDAEQAMKITDRNWELSPDENDSNPKMNLLYTVNNDDKAADWNYYHGSGGQTDFNNAKWNKEHIWAKSNGFPSSSAYAYSDLHHLRAADTLNNNKRSNYAFGEATSGSSVLDKNGDASGKFGNNVYEPLDRDKGDVARALFYMATRYYSGDGSGGTNLTLTDGTDSSNGKWGYLHILLKWNLEDPVDNFESNRNELIYTRYQHNRNPFIDHPEYACKIFGNISSDTKSVCGM